MSESQTPDKTRRHPCRPVPARAERESGLSAKALRAAGKSRKGEGRGNTTSEEARARVRKAKSLAASFFFFFPRPTSRRRGRYDCTPPRPSSLHSCFLLQRAARREEKEIEKGVPGWWWWRWKGACGLRNKSCDSLHDNGNRAVHGGQSWAPPRVLSFAMCAAPGRVAKRLRAFRPDLLKRWAGGARRWSYRYW